MNLEAVHVRKRRPTRSVIPAFAAMTVCGAWGGEPMRRLTSMGWRATAKV